MALQLPHAEAPLGPHTWEDFLALDEDDERELVGGHFVRPEGEEAVPTLTHEATVVRIAVNGSPRERGMTGRAGVRER